MILDGVFQFLKVEGLTRTHAAFSTDYLGHSPRYYDYLRCSGAKPSLRALLKLALRLSDMAQASVARGGTNVAPSDLAKAVIAQALARCR